MTPTTDEIREMAESLEAPIYWLAGTDAPSAEENVAPRRAAVMLRLWIAERERGEQKSVKGRHWQAYIEEYELEHGKGSFDATGE